MSTPQEKVNLRDPAGNVSAVSADVVPDLLEQGWEVESEAGQVERIAEQELERAYGDRPVTAAALGAAEALTLGGSTALLGQLGDPEQVRETLERNRAAALAGGIAGHLGAAGLTGGGSLLRLTPAGALARGAQAVARTGARGGLPSRAAAAAVGFGAEGAVQGAGNYAARLSLQENPEFSGEALAESIGLGALLGAGAGVAGVAAGGAAKRLLASADEANPAKLRRALDEISPSELPKLAKAVEPEAGSIGYRKLIPAAERTPAKIAERATRVVAQVDNAQTALAGARRQAKELFSPENIAAAPVEGVENARAQVNAALQSLADAQATARRWQRSWSRDLTPDQIRTGKLPTMADDRAGLAIKALGGLDTAAKTVETAMARARGLMGVPAPVPAAAAAATAAPRGMLGRAQDVAGLYALAQDAGVPLPEMADVPVIGPAVDAYLKFRIARRAFQGRGAVARTPQTRAAARVADTRNRISSAVQRLTVPAVRMAVKQAVPGLVSPPATARRIREIQASDPASVASAVRAELGPVDPEIAEAAVNSAQRKISYLQQKAPRPPAAGSPFSPTPAQWEPPPLDAALFSAQVLAVEAPALVLDRLLAGAWSDYATAQAEAIRETHPALFATVQASLTASVNEIVDNTPYQQRSWLGELFDVPLTGRQLPEYSAVAATLTPQRPPEPSPDLGAPRAQPVDAMLSAGPEERRLLRRG